MDSCTDSNALTLKLIPIEHQLQRSGICGNGDIGEIHSFGSHIKDHFVLELNLLSNYDGIPSKVVV